MAITGVMLSVFVLAHMAGNLLVLFGQDAINAYAEGLKSTPALLWGMRSALLVTVVVHIVAAVRLTAMNRAARPVKYTRYRAVRTPFYARVMPWTGMILLAFIVYHLLHFTVGVVAVTTFAGTPGNVDALGRPDVYSMMVHGFQNPLVAGSYLVAMVLLCMHLAHGVSSMFQSIGFSHPKYNTIVRYAGPVFAGVVFAGNTLIVLAILSGAVALPGA
jgi:succinate dehydrogenase / fumarate reductase cytochrome b subunit